MLDMLNYGEVHHSQKFKRSLDWISLRNTFLLDLNGKMSDKKILVWTDQMVFAFTGMACEKTNLFFSNNNSKAVL